jgi:hypothetical protein
VLMAVTVVVGVVTAFLIVPHAEPGPAMLMAQATATAAGAAVGFVGVVIYLRRALGGGLPLLSAVRVGASVAVAALVGHFLPAHGKILGLAVIVAVGAIYLGLLLLTGELGAADRSKLARILRRR